MATETLSQAFADRRAFVAPMEPHLGEHSDTVLVTQHCDGPSFIQVGERCTDEYLRQVWQARSSFPALTHEQLVAARDGHTSAVALGEAGAGI